MILGGVLYSIIHFEQYFGEIKNEVFFKERAFL